jgi:hypothetical protein
MAANACVVSACRDVTDALRALHPAMHALHCRLVSMQATGPLTPCIQNQCCILIRANVRCTVCAVHAAAALRTAAVAMHPNVPTVLAHRAALARPRSWQVSSGGPVGGDSPTAGWSWRGTPPHVPADSRRQLHQWRRRCSGRPPLPATPRGLQPRLQGGPTLLARPLQSGLLPACRLPTPCCESCTPCCAPPCCGGRCTAWRGRAATTTTPKRCVGGARCTARQSVCVTMPASRPWRWGCTPPPRSCPTTTQWCRRVPLSGGAGAVPRLPHNSK